MCAEHRRFITIVVVFYSRCTAAARGSGLDGADFLLGGVADRSKWTIRAGAAAPQACCRCSCRSYYSGCCRREVVLVHSPSSCCSSRSRRRRSAAAHPNSATCIVTIMISTAVATRQSSECRGGRGPAGVPPPRPLKILSAASKHIAVVVVNDVIAVQTSRRPTLDARATQEQQEIYREEHPTKKRNKVNVVMPATLPFTDARVERERHARPFFCFDTCRDQAGRC